MYINKDIKHKIKAVDNNNPSTAYFDNNIIVNYL